MYYLLKNQILHKLASEQQIKSSNSCGVVGCVFKMKINHKNGKFFDGRNENLPSFLVWVRGKCVLHKIFPKISHTKKTKCAKR